MNSNLLDDDEFGDKLDELTHDIEDGKTLNTQLVKISSELSADPSPFNFNRFKEARDDLQTKITTAQKNMQALQDSAKGNDTRTKQIDKLQGQFKRVQSDYDGKKNEYETLIRNHNPRSPDRGTLRTGVSAQAPVSPVPTQGRDERADSNIPVMQVYNQTEFIEKREKEIQQIHSDAKEINSMAKDINQKIYQGDEKLDKINEVTGKTVLNNMKQANEDLMKAEEITRSRTKNYCILISLMIVGLLAIGGTAYFVFK